MDAVSELARRLPSGAVVTEGPELAPRSHDWSPVAMLREATNTPRESSAAVVFPGSTEEVALALAWAEETRIPVVPRGGGSGVCGGALAGPDAIVLDLSRMDRVLAVDQISQVVRVEAGVLGERLEDALEPYGLTLGHYPQSMSISTVGGWIAASSAGQESAGYGTIEDLLVGATAVLPGGRVLRLRPVPRSAAGPDLRRLLVGSEGTLAVVTEAYLACSPRPQALEWETFRMPSFEAGMELLRGLVRSGAGASVLRAYDEADAALSFGGLGHLSGCVAIVGFPGGLPGLADRRRAAAGLAATVSGESLGEGYGLHWWEHRNDAVDLYRRIMGPDRALGRGVVVDTMEVAGLWSILPDLYGAVRAALGRHAEGVSCHLSHVYPAGSSLYFTFLVRGPDDRDAEARYLQAWDDAVAACLESGGTMTHHHGVGRLKARFLPRELGQEGVRTLRRIKEALDPNGILNPGALIP